MDVDIKKNAVLCQHSSNASVCRLAGDQPKWASQRAEGSLQVD